MAMRSNIPTFDSVTGGTIGMTTATVAGPNVSCAIARLQLASASSTVTVTIGCDSAGNGGLHITGGDPPLPFLVHNLSDLYMKADANVTINYAVER